MCNYGNTKLMNYSDYNKCTKICEKLKKIFSEKNKKKTVSPRIFHRFSIHQANKNANSNRDVFLLFFVITKKNKIEKKKRNEKKKRKRKTINIYKTIKEHDRSPYFTIIITDYK